MSSFLILKLKSVPFTRISLEGAGSFTVLSCLTLCTVQLVLAGSFTVLSCVTLCTVQLVLAGSFTVLSCLTLCTVQLVLTGSFTVLSCLTFYNLFVYCTACSSWLNVGHVLEKNLTCELDYDMANHLKLWSQSWKLNLPSHSQTDYRRFQKQRKAWGRIWLHRWNRKHKMILQGLQLM